LKKYQFLRKNPFLCRLPLFDGCPNKNFEGILESCVSLRAQNISLFAKRCKKMCRLFAKRFKYLKYIFEKCVKYLKRGYPTKFVGLNQNKIAGLPKVCLMPLKFEGAKNSYGGYPTELAPEA
jgi:hypothetical protein